MNADQADVDQVEIRRTLFIDRSDEIVGYAQGRILSAVISLVAADPIMVRNRNAVFDDGVAGMKNEWTLQCVFCAEHRIAEARAGTFVRVHFDKLKFSFRVSQLDEFAYMIGKVTDGNDERNI